MKLFLPFTIVLIFIFAAVLGSQNRQITEFNYLIAASDITVAGLMGISMVFGALIASLIWMTYALRLKLQLRANSQKIHNTIHKND